MSTLTNTKVKDTYPLLLKVTAGLSTTLTVIEDGDATDSALSLSTTTVGVKELTFTTAPSTSATATNALFVDNGVAVSRTLGTSAFEDAFSLTAGSDISVTGTYPNLVVNNTAPDKTVAITGDTYIVPSGTYPNFTLSSPLTGTFVQFNGDLGVHAASSPNETFTFTGGTGIQTLVENTNQRVVINNTAPDQVVSLTGGQDINVTGTYPSFTINHGIGSIGSIATDTGTPIPFVAMTGANIGLTMNGAGGIVVDADDANKTITIQNTAPDQVVAITGSGSATVTGTYPNFDISVPTVAGVHEEMFVAVNESPYTLAPSSQQIVQFTQPDNTTANTSYHFGTAPAKLQLAATYDHIENISGGDIVVYIDMSAYVDVLSPNSDITYSLVRWDGTTWSTVKSVTRYKGSAGNQVDSFWGIFNLKNGDRLRIVLTSDSGNIVYVQNNQIKFEVKELGNII